MAISFPASPSLNQVYTFGGRSWIWNGYAWQVYPSSFTSGLTVGQTTITGGAAGQIVYDSGGIFSELTTGTGVTTAIGNAVNTAGGIVVAPATLSASAIMLGGGSGTGPSTTTTGTGVVTAIGNAVNTAGGLLAPAAALTANALVIGGGSGTGPSTTTTGTGVVTAVGNAVNTAGGLLAPAAALTANALVIGGGSGTGPSTTTTGTGVVTAIGNNTNSANGLAVLGAGGALSIAQGGTNATSFTTNYVAYFDGTSLTGNSGLQYNGTTFSTTADATFHGVTVGLGAGSSGSSTVVGPGALSSNTTGGSNTAVGAGSLSSNTSGSYNTSVGTNALSSNQNGNSNAAFGQATLVANTSGSANTAFGTNCLASNTSGSFNCAFGSGALNGANTSNNTAIGYNALNISTGSTNLAIGYTAGVALTSGNYNVIIGSYTGSTAPINGNGSNYIVLSDGQSNIRQTIDSSGNVGFGTTAPRAVSNYTSLGLNNTNGGILDFFAGGTRIGTVSTDSSGMSIGTISSTPINFTIGGSTGMRLNTSNQLTVNTTSTVSVGSQTGFANVSTFNNSGITISQYSVAAGFYYDRLNFTNSQYFVVNDLGVGVYLGYGNTSWSSTSDERLKTDLVEIEDGVSKVCSLRAVTGRFKADEKGTSRAFLIAQDVEKVLPEAVNTLDDEIGTMGLSYTDMIPLLVAAIKDLSAQVEELKAKLK